MLHMVATDPFWILFALHASHPWTKTLLTNFLKVILYYSEYRYLGPGRLNGIASSSCTSCAVNHNLLVTLVRLSWPFWMTKNSVPRRQCCGSGKFIPDPGFWFLSIPDPGSRIPENTYSGYRIQGSKRHRIPDPDPQDHNTARKNWIRYLRTY
jgi:hypothetical protein